MTFYLSYVFVYIFIVDLVRRREKVKRDLMRVAGTCTASELAYTDIKSVTVSDSSSRPTTTPALSQSKSPRTVAASSSSTPRTPSTASHQRVLPLSATKKPTPADEASITRLSTRSHSNLRTPAKASPTLSPFTLSAPATSRPQPNLPTPTSSSTTTASNEKEVIQRIHDQLLLTGVALYGVGQWRDVTLRYTQAFGKINIGSLALRFLHLCRRRKEKTYIPLISADSPYLTRLSAEERAVVTSFDEDKVSYCKLLYNIVFTTQLLIPSCVYTTNYNIYIYMYALLL